MAKGQRRDPRKEAFWRGVLGRFGKSGLSVRAFCRREKITEPAFYAWRRIVAERNEERGQIHPRTRNRRTTRPCVPAFVPLVVRGTSTPVADTRIIVELRGGRVLRLPASVAGERLTELVRAVEAVAIAEGGA